MRPVVPLPPNFFFNILSADEAHDLAWAAFYRYVDHHRDRAYFPLISEVSLDIHIDFDDGDVGVEGCESVYLWHRALTRLAPRGPELQEKVLRATESGDLGGRAILVHLGLLKAVFGGKETPKVSPGGRLHLPPKV